MLHVERLFLYLDSAGQFDDGRDFHDIDARLPPMKPSPERRWKRRSDVQRELHRSSTFEHYPRLDPPVRPRSPPPPHPRPPPDIRLPPTRSPLYPKLAPSLLSHSFDDDRRLRSDARSLSDSYYPGVRSGQTLADQPGFPRAAVHTMSEYAPPIQPASYIRQLVDKQKKRRKHEKACHGFRSSVASSTKLQRRLPKLAHDKWHRREQSGVKLPSSQTKNSTAVSISQRDLPLTCTDSVPDKAAETVQVAETGSLLSEAGSQLPADTSEAGSESAVPVRPEDIIIIRRYNVDGSAAEKKPDDVGQNAKRHIVRLVRNNILTLPLAASASGVDASIKKEQAKSDVSARLHSVVKRRNWSGVVKTAQVATSQHSTATDRVDVRAHPDHTSRSVDICIHCINYSLYSLEVIDC